MRAEALVLGGYQENKGKDMTSDKKARGMRIAKVIYCTVTLLFVLPLMMTGVTFLMGFRPNIDNVVTHLGYPLYVMKILGVAKILGGTVILWGRFRTLKEWAYAGFTFNMVGAIASHIFIHEGLRQAGPELGLLCLILISYRQWRSGRM